MWQSYPLLEDVPVLHAYCGLQDNTAIWLIQREVETELMQTFMGRRVNMRFADTSSIWRSRDPESYFKRLTTSADRDFASDIAAADPIMVLMTHEVLCHVKIVFDALPQAKLVWGRRHPVDLACSWHRRGWGERFGLDPRSTFPAFDGPDGPLPWHALHIAEEYTSLNPMDRVIYSLEHIENSWVAGYEALPPERRARIHVVTFEQAVTDADNYVDGLCKFLGTGPSPVTASVVARERVPRDMDRNEFDEKLEFIRGQATPHGFERLVEMVRRYESLSRDLFGMDVAPLRRHVGAGTFFG
jgi:hypothetical protein